jgi:hypothetical protein
LTSLQRQNQPSVKQTTRSKLKRLAIFQLLEPFLGGREIDLANAFLPGD